MTPNPWRTILVSAAVLTVLAAIVLAVIAAAGDPTMVVTP